MIGSFEDLRRVLASIFIDVLPPKPLHLVEPVAAVRAGSQTAEAAASRFGTRAKRLRDLAAAVDPLAELGGGHPGALTPTLERRVRAILGQLVLGSLAEAAFEHLYNSTLGTTELRLHDDRQTRGDTDYLVLNGMGHRVFRINIKFHDALFQRAKELVGLDPLDCFPLATYKIYAALNKQEEEHVSYIFVIVGVAGLSGETVGSHVPEDLVHLAALPRQLPRLGGVRQIEDQIVRRLTSDPITFGFNHVAQDYSSRIGSAQWFVLSARRANTLLRELLFERAYGLRVRGFTRNYPRAELDMHFSLSKDLAPLSELLEVLREHGVQGLVARLERGTL